MANLGSTIINGMLRINGKLSVSDAITAPSFEGTATRATQDGDGKVISSTYLKLTGGTMTGNIYLNGVADSATGSTSRIIFGNSTTHYANIAANTIGAIIFNNSLTTNTNAIGYTGSENTFRPIGDNTTATLGTANYKWANVFATTFTGNLSGTATKATQDGSGNTITSTYYKNTGGTLTTSAYNGVIIKRSDTNGSSIMFSNSSGNLGKLGFGSNGDLIITKGAGTDGQADMLKITNAGAMTTYGSISPSANNTASIGSSSMKYANVYATTFTGALSGNATSATTATSATKATQDGDGNIINTTYNKLDGGNAYVTLTAGDGNTTGYRLVFQKTLATWTNIRMVLSISSRHQATGILSIGVSTGSTLADFYYDGRIYGSETSWTADSWISYYNSTTGVYSLFWKFNDYSDTRVSILEKAGWGDTKLSNGTWMTSINEDTYGTKYSIKLNQASSATKLTTARTIGVSGVTGTAQSFDGSKNIVIPITAVPASLVTGTVAAATKATQDGNGKTISSTYLPLAGGTMTGRISSAASATTYILGVSQALFNATYTTYGSILSAPVKSGRICLSTYPSNDDVLYFGYASASQISNSTNSFNQQMRWKADTNTLYVNQINDRTPTGSSDGTVINVCAMSSSTFSSSSSSLPNGTLVVVY